MSCKIVGVGGMRGAGMSMKKTRPSRQSIALGSSKFVCNEAGCGLEFPTPHELADHIMVHGMQEQGNNNLSESILAIKEVNRMETLEALEELKEQNEMDHLDVEIHHDADWQAPEALCFDKSEDKWITIKDLPVMDIVHATAFQLTIDWNDQG